MFEDITNNKKLKNHRDVFSQKERIDNVIKILKGEKTNSKGKTYLNVINNKDNFIEELEHIISYIKYGYK